MIILKVPYSEKDQAKALGARWDKTRKVWYVPDGQATAPFERWHPIAADGNASGIASSPAKVGAVREDSYVGLSVVGKHYIALAHDCSPFSECPECRPILEASGWLAAGKSLK